MQDNALPRTARATVSRRILAGEPVDAAESTLNEVLAKQRIDLNSDPDDSRAHGRDERVAVARFFESLEFWNRLARRMTDE